MAEGLDLLIVKPGNQKRLYQGFSSSLSGLEPPLWAGLIAGFIRENRFSVQIIDAEAEDLSIDAVVSGIIKQNPILVAFIISGTNPSASTPSMPGASLIINTLKRDAPGIKVLLAGLHPSALPQQSMREERVDFVCEGEGFYTILELLKEIKSKGGRYNIKGLWYRKNGKIISNDRAPLIENLDMLPFAAWDLLPMDKYRAHNWHCFGRINQRQPYGVIYTSLGCPFKCKFCCINAIFGKHGIRYRSPQRVVEEIDYLVKNYAVKNIKILDEMFALDEKHVLGICGLLIERGYDLNMWAYARVDTVNENMLKKMKQAGINWLGVGIESANEDVRHGVSKGRFNKDKIRESVDMIHRAGIYIAANYIFGLPHDDLTTMQETLDLAKEINCEYSNFYAAMAYPGSRLYEEALEKQMSLPEDWLGYAQFSAQTLPLATECLSSAQILRFRDKAFEDYHSSPKYLKMIEDKFGLEAVEHINQMLKHKIERKYS